MKTRSITPREQRSLDQLNAIQSKVLALDALKMPDLWKVWDVHFPRRPIHPNRKFMTDRLSHRFQELAFGTLPLSTRERLADYGQQLSKIKSKTPLKAVAMPGATLVREFDGKEYRVQVLADGRYEYNRQIYGSLSAIAKTIRHTLVRTCFLRSQSQGGSMSMSTQKRCAVYCRVSSDERLDQSFNSIDAQRESGLSHVISQRNEGWVPVQDTYEDPGYSGGNMERPGLKRLMADIKAGKVDMVVVYKIDRLSRSLADFAKMVEVFDKHQVSFSSVTQQINSATSTGRLMLNMLLSFAQFEREVTGERIRDKIAASKRKGLWMGGVVPLGYRVEDRQLLIDTQESETVNWIFDTYASTGSTTLMVQQMKEQNRLTKSGRHFCKQSLHKILKNRVYLGMISHKGQYYSGAHQPLVNQAKWDCVQQLMARTSEAKNQATWAIKARTEFLLRGLIYSPEGDLYLPMATQKKSGKVYRYYVHNKKMHEGASQSSIPNQPAEPLEQEVTKQVLDFLRSGTMLTQYWHRIQSINPRIPEPQAVVLILQRTAKIWDNYFDQVKSHIIRSLVERITLHEDDTVEVSWRTDNWIPLLETMKPKTVGAELLEMEMPA